MTTHGGDHAHDGSHRTIPQAMGLLRFDAVERPGLAQLRAGVRPEILGRVTIVVESDATPSSAIMGRIQVVQNEIRAGLVELVEREQLDVNNPQASINALSERVQRTLSTGNFGDWVDAAGDPDDPLGFHVVTYVAAGPEIAAQLPIPVLAGGNDEVTYSAW